MTPFLAISVGGALGANTRYLVGTWVTTQWGTQFPVGTLLINVSGSCVLGVYLTLATERFAGHPAVRLLVATGFLGAYTTFSTFAFESVGLVRRRAYFLATSNVLGSTVLGLLGAWIGAMVASAI